MAYGSLDASYGQTHTSCTIRGVGVILCVLVCVWRLCASSAGCVCPAREHFENLAVGPFA